MLTPEEVWPPYGVVLREGDLTMTVMRESDLPELVALAQSGVHRPGWTPFAHPWTDVEPERLPAEYARFHASLGGQATAEHLSLQFVVRRDGEALGSQGVSGDDVALLRSVETGSWLALRHQGQGVGTRMRRMVCAFAFDGLGMTEVTSGAFLDNPASLRVSEKVGYRPNGVLRTRRRDALAHTQKLVLTPDAFVRGAPVTMTGVEALRTFLGLPHPAPAS